MGEQRVPGPAISSSVLISVVVQLRRPANDLCGFIRSRGMQSEQAMTASPWHLKACVILSVTCRRCRRCVRAFDAHVTHGERRRAQAQVHVVVADCRARVRSSLSPEFHFLLNPESAAIERLRVASHPDRVIRRWAPVNRSTLISRVPFKTAANRSARFQPPPPPDRQQQQ